MSKAVILQHVEYETPARILPALRKNGISVDVRHLYRGDEVPSDVGEIGFLLVMGGPMGVADIAGGKYPFLQQEVDLLKTMIQRDLPVVGICLGAQLLAHAAGANVYRNTRPGAKPEDAPIPAPELGWGPVTLPFPGGTEPILFGMHDKSMMFHWHFDTFDLPKLPVPANALPPKPPAPAAPTGNMLLSSTRACRNQAYRFKNRLFGFQYHFEMTPDGIEAILQDNAEELQRVLGPGGAEQVRQDTTKYYPGYQRIGDRIIGNIIQFLNLA